MDRQELRCWLLERNSQKLEQLWHHADRVRRENIGDAVYLRGLLEISNYCERSCFYCGIRAGNTALERYRLTVAEILEGVGLVQEWGIGTVVLQAGEDPTHTVEWVGKLIRKIKERFSAAITLSLGERSYEELAYWKKLGADRYLLRFETSNPELYARLHPAAPGKTRDRLAILKQLRDLGYEVGSGVMVGLPGQRYDDLVEDLLLFKKLDLDMIGIGPYLVHPETPLGSRRAMETIAEQVPATEEMTYKMVALARLQCPSANIPSTTALATINPLSGYVLGLQRGANIVMPNLTPLKYRSKYDIYPGKARVPEDAYDGLQFLQQRLTDLGRTIGVGRGDSPNWQKRGAAPAEVSINA